MGVASDNLVTFCVSTLKYVVCRVYHNELARLGSLNAEFVEHILDALGLGAGEYYDASVVGGLHVVKGAEKVNGIRKRAVVAHGEEVKSAVGGYRFYHIAREVLGSSRKTAVKLMIPRGMRVKVAAIEIKFIGSFCTPWLAHKDTALVAYAVELGCNGRLSHLVKREKNAVVEVELTRACKVADAENIRVAAPFDRSVSDILIGYELKRNYVSCKGVDFIF